MPLYTRQPAKPRMITDQLRPGAQFYLVSKSGEGVSTRIESIQYIYITNNQYANDKLSSCMLYLYSINQQFCR